MKKWKKWTICLLIIAMFAIFPRVYAAEHTVPDAEKTGSQVFTADSETDVMVMVLAALLGSSLAVNALSAIYIYKKIRDEKTRQIDDVPLVEYDIDDDII